MGLFNLFKKKKDKKEVDNETEKYELAEEFREPTKPMPTESIECEHCHNNIEQWDKSTKFENKRYHIKCMRQLRKQAKRMAFG